jgi:anaphase-promoting complex subunit 1
MAFVTSLGIHRPSALPYFTSEGLLPLEPSADAYAWYTSNSNDGARGEDDELVVTKRCVVWSRGGVVQKAFKFDVEGESVVHAVLTYFESTASSKCTTLKSDDAITKTLPPQTSSKAHAHANDPHASFRHGGRQNKSTTKPVIPEREKALVIFLQSQAHVYFLKGTSHIIHLPFEVESALAAPRGLIIQRKLSANTSTLAVPSIPSAPPNVFYSSQTRPESSASFNSFTVAGLGAPKQLDLPPAALFGDLWGPTVNDAQANMPRLFVLTDPLSEMGLVTTAPMTHVGSFSASHGPSRTSTGTLSRAEEMLYISEKDEFPYLENDSWPGLILALTINHETNMYTVWNVTFVKAEPLSANSAGRRVSSGTYSRRRSSFAPGAGTGATTPVGPSGTRESFGHKASQSVLATSQYGNRKDGTSTDEQEQQQLASALDVDFNQDGPSKQSRRVSSLLARAELSGTHDRSAFTDLASGHTGGTASGLQAGGRRGDSLGGHNTRSSFGISGRVSLPGNASQANFKSSAYADPPVDELLEELNAGGDFDGFDTMRLDDVSFGGLRKEVIMAKIESFPVEQNTIRFSGRDFLLDAKPKVFTLMSPPKNDHSGDVDSVLLCVMDNKDRKLHILTLHVQKHQSGFKSSLQVRKHSKPAVAAAAASNRLIPFFKEVSRGSDVIDAVKIEDGGIERILVLSETENGHGEITLRAPWSAAIKITLPGMLAIFDSLNLGLEHKPGKRREAGFKRVLSNGPRALRGLTHSSPAGIVNIVDDEGNFHRVQIRMCPRNPQVEKIISICRYVLPGIAGGEGILVGWWQVCAWLRSKDHGYENEEWAALVITLFSLAIPLIRQSESISPSKQIGKQPKKKRTLLRSSSGAECDVESWNTMLDHERNSSGGPDLPWMENNGWSWVLDEEELPEEGTIASMTARLRSTRHSVAAKLTPKLNQQNPLILQYISSAREFLASPIGQVASGDQGYLPTASFQTDDVRQSALARILIALHLLREEQKLDITTSDAYITGVCGLTPILAQIGSWLGWDSWGFKESGFYSVEDVSMDRWTFDSCL